MSTELIEGNSGGAAGDEATKETMKVFTSLPTTSASPSHSVFTTTTFEPESELIERIFEVPKILEEILKKLNNKNIRNCRSVSKTWNNVAKGILKNELYLRPPIDPEMLHDFCETINSSIEGISMTFQHLHFWGDNIPSMTRENPLNSVKQHVTRLEWSAVGKMGSVDEVLQLIYNHFLNLKKVDILLCGNNNSMEALPSDFEVKMIPYSGKPLLQLEDLCFTVRVAQPRKYLNRVNCLFKTLIASAVNLKYLSLNSWFTEERGRIKENVISSISSCKIQKIEMGDFYLSVENIDALSNHHLDFPLTKLRLEINLDKVDLEPLLKRCSPYLMELDLKFTKDHAHVDFPFGVHLKKLWSLKLKNAREQFYIDWSKISQIRKLVLRRGSLNGIISSFISSPSHCTHLETLQIQPVLPWEIQLKFSPPINQMLTHLNSQLTSLYLHGCWWEFALPLALIFKECTSLKYFNLWLGRRNLTDGGLCGVDDRHELTVTWPEDNRVKGSADNLDDEASLDLPYHFLVNQVKNPDGAPHRPFPYIGNLKELQVLELDGDFTELALLHGIVHCRNLTRIYLNSPLICRKRAARIIRNADLVHLRSASLSYQIIGHLPEEFFRKVPTRNEPPPPTTTVSKVKSESSLL